MSTQGYVQHAAWITVLSRDSASVPGGGEHYVAMLAGCWSVVGGGQLADKRSSGLPGPCTVLSLVLSLPWPFAPHVRNHGYCSFGEYGYG